MSKILLFIQQKMAIHLRNRGWVVFYLEESARKCHGDFCWLNLYESEEGRSGEK